MSKIWKALEHAQHKIMDTANLIKDKDKSKIQIPLNTLSGSKYLLYVINFAFICIVIILSIISVSIYFFMPSIDEAKLSRVVDIQEDNALPDIKSIDVDFSEKEKQIGENYTIISTRNVFSPQRKEWVVKAVIPKVAESAKKRSPKKKTLARKPKKIILHGVVIAGDIRKALIRNPMTGVSRQKTLYVEEGEEVEGYMVTSIESDQIRLDWQGEEIIVKLYTGLEGGSQQKENEKVSRVNPRKAGIRDLRDMEAIERREKDNNPLEEMGELTQPEPLMMEKESGPE